MIWVRNGSSELVAGLVGRDLLEDPDEDRDDERDDGEHDRRAPGRRRRSGTSSPSGSGAAGRPSSRGGRRRGRAPPRGVRIPHRSAPSSGTACRTSSGWRSIASASELPASTSWRIAAGSPPRGARPRSGPRACRASAASACPERSGWRTAARRPPAPACPMLLKRSMSSLELERLLLLGDVEDDQAALAQLLGDLGLALGLHLARARGRRRRRRPGRRRCSSISSV